jgi:MFS family permease
MRLASRMFESLRVPAFRDLFIGMLASYIGMYMGMVARGYLAYEITGSATVLGVVTVASGVPMLLLSPVGGVLADLMNRRRILIDSQIFMVISSLLIAVLIHLDLIAIWHLAFFGFLQGVLFTINMPARSSALPHLVGRPLLPSAIGLTNSGRNLMSVVAPAIAGTVIAIPWLGTAGAFDIAAVFYVLATLLMLRLPKSLAQGRKSTQTAFGQQMVDGFAYIFTQRPLLTLLVLGLIPIVFGMPLQSFMPVFQADVLGVGSLELGLLLSAVGVGGTLGSLIIAPLAESKHSHVLQLVAGVFFGITLIAFANSTSFNLSLILVGLVGFAGNASTGFNSALLMLRTEEAYYGRVMSIYMMNWSLMTLFTLPLGILVDRLGAPLVTSAAAMGIIVFMGAAYFLFRDVRKGEHHSDVVYVDSSPAAAEKGA